MIFLEFLDAHPGLAMACAMVIGLLVGSFLNVVVHRLPIMMEREWREQCDELTGGAGDPASVPGEGETEKRINLVTPRSRCPDCGHVIRAHENIPLFSYLLQRGRCTACGSRISLRYPAVELLSGVLAAVVVGHFGVTLQAAAGLGFTFALVALAFVDLDTQYLPDSITLPLLWAGLALNLWGVFVTLESAVIGAMAGYLSLWSIYWLFKLLTGKEGMGHGDFKLMAALGAWMGWSILPGVVFLASMVGAAVGIGLIVLRGHDRQVPIPFGPYIAAAGWLSLIWGHEIRAYYMSGFAGY
jgi:leader peptidase (prepilin peptidase)/N-methyltransferase